MASVRAFIAVRLHGDAADAIAEYVRAMETIDSSVKWVEVCNLHLTLKFLGDTERSRIPALQAAVGGALAGGRQFRVGFAGAGAFPNVSRPRVLWVGVRGGAEELSRIALAIDDSTIASGFPGADKAFRPHLTIGRARGESAGAAVSKALACSAGASFGSMLVDSVHIVASTLTPAGPIYTTLSELKLRA
ncbi:MAG: RNA 2',3'-cyclic phosphodiesterase [Clostridia bacterium]|nr:RNA 2',3'-cyclic phosphodiesterase [Clostridia bacterium]